MRLSKSAERKLAGERDCEVEEEFEGYRNFVVLVKKKSTEIKNQTKTIERLPKDSLFHLYHFWNHLKLLYNDHYTNSMAVRKDT